ncbi:hypothetical protein QQS21_007717 [Conoideocrella luteorostrata]|uniref:Uncharacterized protein n=1 Tax=Conoideocrella luteorostrata TaxID=1105319 RepID=A0AAJ0CL24_9HYPO|nr:hypothetical protein QQS21_007717 [Conoideocrella luteorostrata]
MAAPNDVETALISCAEKERYPVFLQVIDAPFDGSSEPQLNAEICVGEDIALRMRHLPPHARKTARILDVTIHSDFVVTGLRETEGPEKTQKERQGLMEYLQNTYTERFDERRIFRWLNDPLLVNDIGSISSQWSQCPDDKTTHFYRLVNRTSLQQDPLDYDLRPRDSHLTCVQDKDERLLVIIVHDVWYQQRFRTEERGKGEPFENPRSITKMLNGTSWTCFYDGTLETFAKLVILDFFEASIYLQPVNYYEDLIYPKVLENEGFKILAAHNPHLQVPLGLFEPRLSAKSREAFKEIEDAEGILRNVNNLVDSIVFVTKTLRSKSKKSSSGTQQKLQEYKRRMQDLEGLRSERCSNADRALNALNRQLDYLTKRHAISEAKAIRILTILASFYLPLSLAASLLGMQTPFRQVAHDVSASDDKSDLVGTNLLFDFFGVYVVLATSTVLIVHIIRFGLWVKMSGLDEWSQRLRILPRYFSGQFSILSYDKRWRFDGNGGVFFKYVRILTRWWIGLGLGVLLLVIFIKGMLRDSQNAWNYAQWGFIAYLAVSVIFLVLYAVTYGYLYHNTFGGRWFHFIRQ